MTLVRQLWTGIIALILVSFISSFLVSTLAAQEYLQEQLYRKNIDNANVLAMILSQTEKDQALLQTTLAAQFDGGHYQKIILEQLRGEPIVLQRPVTVGHEAPEWFVRWFDLDVPPGMARVLDGWNEYGTLILASDPGDAYGALWSATQQLFGWLLLIALGFGIAGTLLLKWLTQPLGGVVKQAESIGNQQFMESPVPRTSEFRRVVLAMNQLSRRVRTLLEKERQQIEQMRYRAHHDDLTGLLNRAMTLGRIDTLLQDEEHGGEHALILIRLCDLAAINRQLGHQDTDRLLCQIAEMLREIEAELDKSHEAPWVGRIGGADFALVFTGVTRLQPLVERIFTVLEEGLATWRDSRGVALRLALGASHFRCGESRATVLMRQDDLVARAEQQPFSAFECESRAETPVAFASASEWRVAIVGALSGETLFYQAFPVVNLDGELLHQECMLRIPVGERVLSAGQVLPWARRLELQPALDVAMVRLVLREMQEDPLQQPCCINLSIETLRQPETRQSIVEALYRHRDLATRLSLECTESMVINHTAILAEFTGQVALLGCRVGIDHAGFGFLRSDAFQTIGLAYIKLDPTLIAEIHKDPELLVLLQRLCTLSHSVGMKVIADGMTRPLSPDHWEAGVDGIGGPAARRRVEGG